MCGRSVSDFSDVDVSKDKIFAITETQAKFEPNYNVAPTQQIPVIIPGSRILTTFRWGLIPFWAKDKKIGYKMINARSESLIEKPSFKNLLKNKRCLILASGFYEWDKNKQPHYIQIKNHKIIAYAGLWDEWTDKETNEKIRTCTIITCPANKFMQMLHHRMPVILQEKDLNTWLTSEDFTEIRSLLLPYNDKDMIEHKVNKDVGNVKNNSRELIDEI